MKDALRRFLKPENFSPVALLAGSTRLDDFWSWTKEFAESETRSLRLLVRNQADGTCVVLPNQKLSQFKLDPELSFRLVRETLDELGRSLPEPGRVVWALDCYQTHGLESFEAEAVFSPWLAIEHIFAADLVDRSKLIVVGRFREECVGLAFSLEGVQGTSAMKGLACLELAGAQDLPFVTPIATLFVSASEAKALAAAPLRPLTQVLRQRTSEGVCSLGLRIEEDERRAVFESLREHLQPLEWLNSSRPVRYVRLDEVTDRDLQPQIGRALIAAGLDCEASFGSGGPASYVRAGAYWPQPFDRRTPAGTKRGDVPVEISTTTIGERSIEDVWRWRAQLDRGDRDRLVPLLTFSRIETYHRDQEQQLEFAQAFHDFRVFNWPRPEPAARVTLLDGGVLDNPLRVAALMRQCKRLSAASRGHISIGDGNAVRDAAMREASARLPTSTNAALRDQETAHAYLEGLPREGPLRADYAAFAQFLPASLGRTLELGSGYGQLARVLSPRASKYVCLDFDRKALAAVRDSRARGVSADFHHLPFSDGSFETIVANNVLEHAYDPATSLREIQRVLRAGGRLLALVPLDGLNPAHDLRAHWWKADQAAIERALRMAGLAPQRLEQINLYDLGVNGAFPAQNGIACQIDAVRT